MSKKTLICITGLPGAGKTLASQFIAGLGNYPIIVMGDLVREEAEKRRMSDIQKLMFQLRREEGRSAIAKRCIPLIEWKKSQIVIVDGIRNIEEIEEFKKNYQVYTIAISCLRRTRFERLYTRKRKDDPKLWKEFIERESAEKEIGIEEAIQSAEFIVGNDGKKEELKRNLERIVKCIVHSN